MKRMACAIAFAAGTGLAAGGAQVALAEPAAVATSGLQIAIGTPGADEGGSNIALDVNFHGGNIHSIELYVDGELIKRQAIHTRDGHGVISFALDESILTEGAHDILVKAFDADGSSATATTRLTVSSSALARFKYPKAEATVHGTVPIEVKVDSSVKNPYVTFLLDKQFLGLTNFAPFTYNWDTTKDINGKPGLNGPHTLGIEVYDGDTLAKVQTLTRQVTVDNVGGFTARESAIPDLNAKPPSMGSKITDVAMAAAQASSPQDHVAPQISASVLLRSTRAVTGPLSLRSSAPVMSLEAPNGGHLADPQTPRSEATRRHPYVALPSPLTARAFPPDLLLIQPTEHASFRPGVAHPSLSVKPLPERTILGNPITVRAPAAVGEPAFTALLDAIDLSIARTLPAKPAPEVRVAEPNPYILEQPSLAAPNPNLNSGAPLRGPSMTPPRIAPGLMGLLAVPQDLTVEPTAPREQGLARDVVHPRRAGIMAARPSLRLTPSKPLLALPPLPRTPTVAMVSPAPIHLVGIPASAPVHVVHLTRRPGHARQGSGDLVHIRVKSFQVAFDNTQIAFDVPPRVEHGLPLAPFRPIFEHTGGVVQWFQKAKMVRAINTTREIEIHVGQKQAKVNNRAVEMQSTPYIDHGRTIVPLSFVRDALHVKVQYDASSGHLRIESQR